MAAAYGTSAPPARSSRSASPRLCGGRQNQWPEGFCCRDIGWQAAKREQARAMGIPITRHSGRRAKAAASSLLPRGRRLREAPHEGSLSADAVPVEPNLSLVSRSASHVVHPLPQGGEGECGATANPARGVCRGAVLLERLDDVLPIFHWHLVRLVDQPLRAHLGVPFASAVSWPKPSAPCSWIVVSITLRSMGH